jgi:hypothetical protein
MGSRHYEINGVITEYEAREAPGPNLLAAAERQKIQRIEELKTQIAEERALSPLQDMKTVLCFKAGDPGFNRLRPLVATPLGGSGYDFDSVDTIYLEPYSNKASWAWRVTIFGNRIMAEWYEDQARIFGLFDPEVRK